MRKTYFGRIERLEVRNGQPMFNPPPRIMKDVKLGAEDVLRREVDTVDFALKREHVELFDKLANLGDGVVELIQIRHGLPCMLTIEQHS